MVYVRDQSRDLGRCADTLLSQQNLWLWGPAIELVDVRYRPEVNTIGALAESDPSEQAPFAEPMCGPQRVCVKSSQVVSSG